MTKEQWVDLFEKSGVDKAGRQLWHEEFERIYPEEHQKFLEWLNIDKDEIKLIREQSGR